MRRGENKKTKNNCREILIKEVKSKYGEVRLSGGINFFPLLFLEEDYMMSENMEKQHKKNVREWPLPRQIDLQQQQQQHQS